MPASIKTRVSRYFIVCLLLSSSEMDVGRVHDVLGRVSLGLAGALATQGTLSDREHLMKVAY